MANEYNNPCNQCLNKIQKQKVEIKMKCTQYFLHTRNRPDRACIKDEWIEMTIKHPVHTEVQADGRIRHWAKIEEEKISSSDIAQ